MEKKEKRDEKEVLYVCHLCKKDILKNISFSIKRGEMTAIMGPSGSGKSTLLYNVSGMDNADSGEVYFAGYDIQKQTEEEKARFRLREAGFVFQQMNMLSDLNILDNILLPAFWQDKVTAKQKIKGKIKGRQHRAADSRQHRIERAKKLMEEMGIAQLADRKVTEVSGGQLQRACICRSMINEPQILFADEPTGALNRQAADEVMQIFGKLNQDGTTILLVTHDSRVASCCHRILYLADGEIIGALELGREEEKREIREEKVAEWLKHMEW